MSNYSRLFMLFAQLNVMFSSENTISADAEADLAETIVHHARRGFPFRKKRIMRLAYEYCERNHIPGFSKKYKQGGRDWLKGFMVRHPQISRKNSKNLSLHRAASANPGTIQGWMTGTYKTWLQRLKIEDHPNMIWDVDECGLQDIPQEGAVYGAKGESANTIVGGEQGTTTTVVCFVSAGGLRSPPLIIFKGSRYTQDFRDFRDTIDFPCYIRKSTSGYVNAELFCEYAQNWCQWLDRRGLCEEGRTLLLLDQHKSHLYNEKFLNYMKKESKVNVGSFPPHSTHKLQPLDDVPYASLKVAWNNELSIMNEQVGGVKLNRYEWMKTFKKMWDKCMTPEAIRKGFINTGIYPYNPRAAKLQQLGPAETARRVEESKLRFRF